ncbi:MAG: TerB family tellurite resistance protein [Myxococcales bacterium]|nr:TerB family tellurite resistance protein [Myxococcales bacterium]
MFGWLKRDPSAADPEQARALYAAVREHLDGADDVQVRIVASFAALLICIAYADHEYSREEEALVRRMLARVQGLDGFAVDAIVRILDEHKVRIVGAEATTYARELLELTEEDFRLEVLDGLVDLAAADGTIRVAETNVLRQAARALGLSQAQYNASQARHRDKLAVLGGD